MTLLHLSGWQLGSNSTPDFYARKVVGFAHKAETRILVLTDMCMATATPRADITDCQAWHDTLGPQGEFYLHGSVWNIWWILGPHDLWVLDSEYRDIRLRLEGHGVHLSAQPTFIPSTTTDCHRMLVHPGYTASMYQEPPVWADSSLLRRLAYKWRIRTGRLEIDAQGRFWQHHALAAARLEMYASFSGRKTPILGILHAGPHPRWSEVAWDGRIVCAGCPGDWRYAVGVNLETGSGWLSEVV